MQKHILAASAMLLIATSPALAEGMGQHHGNRHAMLKKADTNHDGKVSKSEFLAAAATRAEKRFNHMDANHDGVLDKQDHQAHFDKMDSNHDGSISREEFQSFHEKMKGKQ